MKKYCFVALLILAIILIGCSGPDTEGKTFKILYYANGATSGFPPEDSNLYMSGDTTTVLPEYTLKKDGYKFQYWNTKPEGNGEIYHVGDTITVKNYDIFLHAIWAKLP